VKTISFEAALWGGFFMPAVKFRWQSYGCHWQGYLKKL